MRRTHRSTTFCPRLRNVQIYLLLGRRPANIANKCSIGLATVYEMERNLMRYGSALKPKKLTEADTEALLTWLLQED
jgi:transposase